ncbi:MAG: hypothetical protein PVG23_04690 [Nitrosopumilaceae archaeon]|jgi:hypothetical protein
MSSSYAFSNEILIQVENDVRKVYYDGENITSSVFDPESASVIFQTDYNARLEIKAPQVYQKGPGLFILKNGEEIAPEIRTDNCFYYLDIETKVPETIEIVFAYWPEYPEPEEGCDTFTVSPLKQFLLGIPVEEILCKENLVLIQKYNGSPVCVKPETKEKLIERGWANINTDNIRQTVSLPSPPDPMSIAITGNDKLPIFTVKRGETKEIGILLEPKIPITFATVSVDSYFGSAGDCNNISTDSYCPGRGIIMNLSETEITAKKEITLTITIPENMTVGTYGYQIETKTTFDMSSVEKPRTVENSVRFDLKVI